MKQIPGTYNSRCEFFLDADGILYKRKSNGKHQLVVLQNLMQDVMRLNHDTVYAAHPGIKRTYSLIAMRYWWPGMWKSVEDFVKSCDLCQRRNGNREFVAPFGEVEEPTVPFLVTSLDITVPYVTTPRGNKYLLTFIDHFTKYVEAFPIPNQTAETCARIYATQIVTRHGTSSKLLRTKFDLSCNLSFTRHVRYWGYELRAPLVTTLNQMAPLRVGIVHFTRVCFTTLTQKIIIGTH
jgi:hypothetical protein